MRAFFMQTRATTTAVIDAGSSAHSTFAAL